MPLGRPSTQLNFMSEESLPPATSKEQPSEKPAAKPATKAVSKTAKSSAKSSEAKSDHGSDIKRNVRGSKSAARKSTKKEAAKEANLGNSKEEKTEGDKDSQNQSNPSTKQGRRGRGRQGKSQANEPKVKLNDKKVAKRAWKIFLGEVGEEGLALIADKDARELARRSLKIAEIYSQEEAAIYKQSKGGEAK